MTQDEQEALSFRYVAPRVFILSSGNIAVCPMIGREPPRIYTPEEFSLTCIPGAHELEIRHATAIDEQRTRASASRQTSRDASLEDLV